MSTVHMETKSVSQEVKFLFASSWLISLQQLCSIIAIFVIPTSFISQIEDENSAKLIAGTGLSVSFTCVVSINILDGLTVALGTVSYTKYYHKNRQ